VVETSDGDDCATRRNFTLEMMHLGVFSVTKEAVVSDRDMSPPPAKYHSDLSVCLSVCPHDKTKTAETTITKLATGIVHHESSPIS